MLQQLGGGRINRLLNMTERLMVKNSAHKSESLAHRPFRQAFTLTELLVTIGVIGVLAAMSFPALQKGRSRAQQMQCASQLRNIHTAVVQYASDTANYPPAYGKGVGLTWGVWFQWDSPLVQYLQSAENLQRLAVCPANRTTKQSTGDPYGYPYSVNYNVMATVQFIPLNLYRNTRNISVILMTDSVTGSGWGIGYNDLGSNGGTSRIGAPHEQKTNILWCDGHITNEAKSTLRQENFKPEL